jgi:superfamily II DNA or RNA helicase
MSSKNVALGHSIDLYVKGHIDARDARRQEQTANEILRRLKTQPGLILADEVGMGKTFVALSVAISSFLLHQRKSPVVIMVPGNILRKWERDFSTFVSRCVTDPALRSTLNFKSAERAEEFFKCIDDPEVRRPAVVFLTHGAMSRGLTDPWFKLAIIQRAIKGRHGTEGIYRAFSRFGPELLELKTASNQLEDPEKFWLRLLETRSSTWTSRIKKAGNLADRVYGDGEVDDLVPQQVQGALDLMSGSDFQALFDSLSEHLPRREVGDMRMKVVAARKAIKEHMRGIWRQLIRRLDFTSPLLIMDEAHHLKNAHTRIASLFATSESASDASAVSKGELGSVFDRMLFLTATPFQLGHQELTNVLQRFNGVRWTSADLSISQKEYEKVLQELSESLTAAQIAGTRLDSEWGKLPRSVLAGHSDVEGWWTKTKLEKSQVTDQEANVLRAYQAAAQKMRAAEALLRPWVIRHIRPKKVSDRFAEIDRRESLDGASIVDGGDRHRGIEVDNESLLPFLLAGRAAMSTGEARPVFAEGLASSYEAFVDTRRQNAETKVLDTDSPETTISEPDDELRFYLDKIEECLARKGKVFAVSHPKIEKTVNRAVDLWRNGEKVLIFCHYIRTGRVLRQKISEEIHRLTQATAQQELGCPIGEVDETLKRIGNSLADREELLRGLVSEQIDQEHLRERLGKHEEQIFEIVRKLVHTPSFLIRFFPLRKYAQEGCQVTRALAEACMNAKDSSGLSLGAVIRDFLGFLSNRCEEAQREAYLEALKRMQTGSLTGQDASAAFDVEERQLGENEMLMANVRLANGSVKPETRQRLMLGFNTPFFPEVLIASSVMAEGVDLHLNCRHIIHHDLSWNPSTLEQRTGRVDRIGAKVEACGKSIQVYLPYLAGTQDEKMYRVVMDRDRWFKVLMGDSYVFESPVETDRLADRVPFPSSAADELAFNLEVAEEE